MRMKERIGWITVTLNDIAKWGSGGTPKSTKKEYYGGDIPWLIIGDLNDGLVWHSTKKITDEGLKNSSAKIVAPNNILIALYGSIGKLGINKIPVATNQAIAFTQKIHTSTNIKYLFYFLLFSRQDLYKLGKGGTQRNISQTVLKKVKFPLPPFPEQRAIVNKIEQLFSELDNGIANLKLAQEQLKVYRQAVLKQAFTGELTRTWREEHQSEIESPIALLNRIVEGRKLILGEKIFSKKNACNEPSSIPDFLIPEEWLWITPKVIASPYDPYALTIGPFGSNLKVSDYRKSGVPLIFVKNIRSGSFHNSETKFVSKEKADELRPHQAESGDILITKMGEPPGDATQYPANHSKAIITADCVKFRLNPILEEKRFFVYLINSPIIKNQIAQITKGVAQKKISLERFREIALPFPSIAEQQAIVNEIETRLSVCDKLEQDITDSLEKAEALRQSILKQAFEGKLLNEQELAAVRNDPEWEPAEALLAKIKSKTI